MFTDTIPNIIEFDPKKASVENDIPTKILIGSKDIDCDHYYIYNNSKMITNTLKH